MNERKLYMPEISEDELIAHIEDDDFVKVYGNPILIRSKDGNHDCVLMTIEYYERQIRLLEEMEAAIQKMADEAQAQSTDAE